MNSVKSNSSRCSFQWNMMCAFNPKHLGKGGKWISLSLRSPCLLSEFQVIQGSIVSAFPRNKETKIHSTSSIILTIHLEMELQDCIVILFLIFNKLYCTVVLITPSCDQYSVGFFLLFLMMILHVVR